MAISILIFLVVLFSVVTIHELGHFFACKVAKVPVAELGLGFPPRIWAVKRNDTEYSINMIPLGAFVRPVGDAGPASANSLSTRSPWVRIWVSVAGPLANVVLAFILFIANFMMPVQMTIGGQGGAEIVEVLAGSPAEQAGIQNGDIFISIDGQPVQTTVAFNQTVADAARGGHTMDVLVQRGDVQDHVLMLPRANPPEGQGALGIAYRWTPPYITETYRASFPQAVDLGSRMMASIPSVMRESLFSGGATLVGPVGAGQMTVEVVGQNMKLAVLLAGFISIGIATFNVLPVPPLDGGGVAIALVEAIRRGKALSPRGIRLTYTVGTVLLIALFVTITFNDLLRLIRGDTIMP